MTVTTVAVTNRIDGNTSVFVSDIEEDPDVAGQFVRRVEFYTDPIQQGNRRPVLTVMIYGDEEALKIKTPNLTF